MGVDNLQYGSDKVAFFVAESTAFTPEVPAAANAVRVTDFSFGQPVGRQVVPDRKGTRSRMERGALRQPVVPWSLSGILRPSDAAGTAPDMGDIIKHAMGTEAVSGGVSVTYSFLKDMTALTASIYGGLSPFQQGVYGAVVQNLGLNWSGDDAVQWTASGVGANVIRAGTTLADGAGASATALIVDDADFYTKGALISIGGDDNTGAGYQVTAVNHTSQTLTITPAATWDDNDTVTAFLPTGTYAGNPLYTPAGSISFDNGSSSTREISGSLTVNTGIDLLNNEHGSSEATDVILTGMREVDMSLDFYVKEDETYLMGEWRRKVSQDIIKTLGDTAGSRLKINMDTAEIDPQDVSQGDDSAARFSANVIALGSSGEDEMTLVFD